MSIATPEAPTRPVTLDPDLERAVIAALDGDTDLPCQVTAFLGVEACRKRGLIDCNDPALWVLTAKCGCSWNLCDFHTEAADESRAARVIRCGIGAGCMPCQRCGGPMCAGRETVRPL